MAPGRGRDLRAVVERYVAGPERSHAGPRGQDTLSIFSMVVLENGHYCRLRMTPRPPAQHWHLEALNSMLPRDTALPDSPTTLPPE